MTQEQLVDRASERLNSFSKSTLSRLESGQQPYSPDILEALAWALECTPADLIARDPSSPLWGIIESLETLSPDQQEQVAQIVDTFKSASQ